MSTSGVQFLHLAFQGGSTPCPPVSYATAHCPFTA